MSAEYEAADYTRDYYEGHVRRYESGVYGNRVKNITDGVGLLGGGPLLDCGCGIGFFSDAAKDKGLSVVSLDFSQDALDRYRERGANGAVLLRGDVETLPFKDASFPAIMCSDVIEHLYHPERLLAECLRVLEPGGRLLLETDNVDHVMRLKGLRRVNAYLEARTPRGVALETIRKDIETSSLHVHTFGVGELLGLVRGAGFAVEHWRTFQYLPHPVRDAFLRLLCPKRWRGNFQMVVARKV